MEQSGDGLPILIGQSGPLNGERWLIRETLVVGRGEDCDIIIPDRKISRHHARLSPSKQGVMLEDLQSKNGTHHNGNAVKDPVKLRDGDSIQIALAQKFTFLSSDATVPLDFEASSANDQTRRLRLDKRSRRIWLSGEEIKPPLSAAQFTLLDMLYRSEGLVVSREQLVNNVWGKEEAYGVSDQALDALVRRLRDRLKDVDPEHEYVVTVRGHGLRLDNPELK